MRRLAISLPVPTRDTFEAGVIGVDVRKERPSADRRAVRLAELDRAFGSWLGVDYDLDAIHATLAVAAVNRLDGDPAWLLIVGGPGNAKTETVSALPVRTSSQPSPPRVLY